MTDPLLRKTHVHKKKEEKPETCPNCTGTGTNWIVYKSEGKIEELRSTCIRCDGSGVIWR